MTRQLLPNGIAHVFRDVELGELGRLTVETTPAGETRITTEVAGFVSDQMMQRRRDVLEPLCNELTRILESNSGPGRATPLPDRKPQPAGKIL